MNSCTVDISLEVKNADCPDWTQLSWGNPTIAANASFTPAVAGNSNSFQATAANPGSCQSDASIIYNGHGCNCKLHLVTAWAGFSTGVVTVTDATTVTNLLTFQVTSNPAGIYDLPFTLPNTGGVNHTIAVHVQAQAIGGGFSVNFIGTFSNV